MSILKNLTFTQRVALAVIFGVFAYCLLAVMPAGADELTCWPAHKPFVADAGINPYLLGVLLAVAAIFFV